MTPSAHTNLIDQCRAFADVLEAMPAGAVKSASQQGDNWIINTSYVAAVNVARKFACELRSTNWIVGELLCSPLPGVRIMCPAPMDAEGIEFVTGSMPITALTELVPSMETNNG